MSIEITKTPGVLISEEEIAKKVQEIGEQITRDYHGQELIVVCVLKGSFIFCGDLIRHIKVPCTIDFISCSSYGKGTESSGTVKLDKDLREDIAGKNVLLVEDIVDSGLTLSYLTQLFQERNPRSLKVTTLLFKPEKLKCDVKVDYHAFNIGDQFVVGYGLDYAEKFRELPYIGHINE